MQDWSTDRHGAFSQTVHTVTEPYAKELNACATCEQQPWGDDKSGLLEIRLTKHSQSVVMHKDAAVFNHAKG